MKYLVYAIAALTTIFGNSADAAELLFNGHSLAGWTTPKGKSVTSGWQAEDGVLHLPANAKGGHIITDRDYENFVLDFEFKISGKGNSGIKYRVKDYGKQTLGLEYQILDDAHPSYAKLSGNKMTAGLYDIYEPSPRRFLRPIGEYNSGRIVVNGQHIEHWLNGHRVLTAVVGSDEWNLRIAASKFNKRPDFGENARGRIMITDHNNEVWYRNIVIQEIDVPQTPQNQSASMVGPQAGCCHAPARPRCCRPVCRRRSLWDMLFR